MLAGLDACTGWGGSCGMQGDSALWLHTFCDLLALQKVPNETCSMVYTILSRTIVHTLLPCFPRRLYTPSLVLLCDLDRPREEKCHSGGVYPVFSVEQECV